MNCGMLLERAKSGWVNCGLTSKKCREGFPLRAYGEC